MPRRNRRPSADTSLPTRDELGIPLSDEEIQEARWDARRDRTRKREDARALELFVCVWPGCRQPVARFKIGRPIVLCTGHADRVWQTLDQIYSQPAMTEKRAAKLIKDLELKRRRERQQTVTERRRIQQGRIYYLRIDDRVKIGFSVDVKRRMRSYPPNAVLLAVHPGTQHLEAELHKQFAGSRADGREWFYPHPDLLAHIEQVVEKFGPPDAFAYKYRKPTGQVTTPRHWSGRRPG